MGEPPETLHAKCRCAVSGHAGLGTFRTRRVSEVIDSAIRLTESRVWQGDDESPAVGRRRAPARIMYPVMAFTRVIGSALALVVGLAATPATQSKPWTAPRTPDGHPDPGCLDQRHNHALRAAGESRGQAVSDVPRKPPNSSSRRWAARAAPTLAPRPRRRPLWQLQRVLDRLGDARSCRRGRRRWSIDPPDGRVPVRPEAEKTRDESLKRSTRGPVRVHEPRGIAASRAACPASMFPAGYNNAYQIIQTPGYVVILYEMIHDARIIPLDGRPHRPRTIRILDGRLARPLGRRTRSSSTTTNYNDKGWIATSAAGGRIKGIPHSDALHVVERFTRIDADTIQYEATIDDPNIYTRPWKVEFPLTPRSGLHICRVRVPRGKSGGRQRPEGRALQEAARRDAARGRLVDGRRRGRPPPAAAQTAATATTASSGWTVPRTPDGQPDLKACGTTARPRLSSGPRSLPARSSSPTRKSPTTNAARRRATTSRPPGDPRSAPSVHPPWWLDYGRSVVGTRRSSLVVEPADGRIPPLTADAQKRAADRSAASRGRGPADGPEDRTLWERCITRGLPEGMLPAGYNNNVQFLQTPGTWSS